jgi:hypothetical protein
VLSLPLTKVFPRSLRGFKHAGSYRSLVRFIVGAILSLTHILTASDTILSTAQPENTPKMSYLITQMSTGCRIDFVVVSRVVFKVFPCGLG